MRKFSIVVISLLLGGSLALVNASEDGGMKCGSGKCGSSMTDKKHDEKESKDEHKDKKESSMKCGASHMKNNSGKCGSM